MPCFSEARFELKDHLNIGNEIHYCVYLIQIVEKNAIFHTNGPLDFVATLQVIKTLKIRYPHTFAMRSAGIKGQRAPIFHIQLSTLVEITPSSSQWLGHIHDSSRANNTWYACISLPAIK